MKMRSFRTIGLYIGFEFLLSFLIAFLFFFFLFFVNQLLLLAEEVLSRSVSLKNVFLLLLYSMPAVIALTFPFASLVGSLMAIGRLSSSNEIIAFKAAGISPGILFVPMFVLGILFTFVSFVMNDYLLPLGTLNFGKLYREILFANPELELEPYQVKRYQDSLIVTGAVESGKISDLMIVDRSPERDKRIIIAGEARISPRFDQAGVITLELDNVFGHTSIENRAGEAEYFTAGKMLYNILLKDITFSLGALTPREMTSKDVYREIQLMNRQLSIRKQEHLDTLVNQRWDLYSSYLHYYESNYHALEGLPPELDRKLSNFQSHRESKIVDRILQIHWIEFHKKIAIPAGCMAFIIFAFPLGFRIKKHGKSAGFGIGLMVSFIYWAMLIGGQTLGYRTDFSPLLSMWAPNILVLLAGGILVFSGRTR